MLWRLSGEEEEAAAKQPAAFRDSADPFASAGSVSGGALARAVRGRRSSGALLAGNAAVGSSSGGGRHNSAGSGGSRPQSAATVAADWGLGRKQQSDSDSSGGDEDEDADEDDVSLATIHSLYRATAEAITSLHQGWRDKASSSLLAAGGGAAGRALLSQDARSFVDWSAMLRLVARIAAQTLNPPSKMPGAAGEISVFVATKAVNQLLYARDWALEPRGGQHHQPQAAGGGGGGSGIGGGSGRAAASGSGIGGGGGTVVSLELLRVVARRHPHEAARLIHGMELMHVELEEPNW